LWHGQPGRSGAGSRRVLPAVPPPKNVFLSARLCLNRFCLFPFAIIGNCPRELALPLRVRRPISRYAVFRHPSTVHLLLPCAISPRNRLPICNLARRHPPLRYFADCLPVGKNKCSVDLLFRSVPITPAHSQPLLYALTEIWLLHPDVGLQTSDSAYRPRPPADIHSICLILQTRNLAWQVPGISCGRSK